jgi:multisubunit Na+/H+ antiporter MnhF subunit
MNQWLLGAIVLAVCIVPCAGVCFFAGPLSGLAALQVAGGLTTAVLILLAESFRRQPFIDLAVVFAALATVGGILFARILERDL